MTQDNGPMIDEHYEPTADERAWVRDNWAWEDEERSCRPGIAAPPNTTPLMTAAEVADRLRCHVSTVYDLVNQHRLKGFSLTGNTDKSKRGKKGLRILASSVADLIAGGLAEQDAIRVQVQKPGQAVQGQLPPPPRRPIKPPARSGSMVVLPFPGGTS